MNAHLRSVQQHGVACPLDRGQRGGGGLGGHHDLTVGVQQCQRHKGQVAAVEHAVLVVDGAVTEQQRVVAEHGRVEELWRLLGQGDEEVGERGGGREEEDDPDEDEGAAHGADVAVVHGVADGEVALHGHARQDERGGAGGEHRRHHLHRGEA